MNPLKPILLCFLIAAGLFILPKIGRAQADHLVISEIQLASQSDSKDEFVELYNPTAQNINLTDWRLKKKTASGNESNLLSSFPDIVISAKTHLLIAHKTNYQGSITADLTFSGSTYSMADNNVILLYDNNNSLIDKVGLGSAIDKESTAADNPADGESLERKPGNNNNDQDTDNNFEDFFLQSTPNPQNAQNSTPPPDQTPPPDEPENSEEETPPTARPTPYFLPRAIIINEIVSDPADGDTEWIELINNSGKEINLSELIIEDGSGAITNLSGSLGIIGDKRFAIIKSPKGNLDNQGDIVILRYGELVIDQVAYGNWDDSYLGDNAPIARDPYSLIRKQDAFDTNNDNLDWAITATLTKGQPNILTDHQQTAPSPYANQIIINELLPNPLGDEANEFIELKNISGQVVDLTGWQINDNSNKKYAINNVDFSATQIPSNGFFVLTRSKTGLALNNTGGEIVELFGPDEQIVASVKYGGGAPKNQSYSRTSNGQWLWSQTITAGQENIITTPNKPPQAVINSPNEVLIGEIINFDGSDSFDPDHEAITYHWNFGDQSPASGQANPIYLYLTAGDYQVALTVTDSAGATTTTETKIKVVGEKTKIETTTATATNVKSDTNIKTAVKAVARPVPASGRIIELAKIREHNIDDKVAVQGLVAVEPNILGKTIFYIAGSGVQIYSYYQDWPDLKLGDYIQVTGIISQAGGETRIKTKSKNDMVVLEHREPPQPHELAIADINEETEGWLAVVQGEITQISNGTLYLDDSEAEVKVYIKDTTNIDQTKLAEGQQAKITGIVSQTSAGYRLLPRYPSDIEILAETTPITATAKNKLPTNHRDQ
ncbi:MAG: lamin tail domain-containing protein, partial [bacterium]